MKQGTTYNVAVGTVQVQLLQADPFRTRIVLFPDHAVSFSFADKPGVAFGIGPTLSPGQPPLVLCVAEVGLLVTKQFFAIAVTAGCNVGVVEAVAESKEEFDFWNQRKW